MKIADEILIMVVYEDRLSGLVSFATELKKRGLIDPHLLNQVKTIDLNQRDKKKRDKAFDNFRDRVFVKAKNGDIIKIDKTSGTSGAVLKRA